MASRVNPNIIPELLDAIDTSDQNAVNANQELSTGRQVNSLSDNPAAVAELVKTDDLVSQTDQFLQNTSDLQSRFQVADSALDNAVEVMNSAISLGTEGSNGTQSSSDLQDLAQQVNGLMQQMLSLANTTYQGTYIFAGTAVTTQPFSLNAAGGGVGYAGNSQTNTAEISAGESIQTGVPGDQIFLNSGGSVFASLNDLYNALMSGTGIETATSEVESAFDQLNTQAVFYGNALNQMQQSENFLNQEKVNLTQQQTNLVGANMAQAETNLSQAETVQEAVLSATSKILNMPNLLDYLNS